MARRKAWSINEKYPVWSGVVVTAGDVVFYGTMDGWFKAVDARTGDAAAGATDCRPASSASRSRTAVPTAGSTSRCCAGVGGWAGAIVSGGLDPRDATAALGFVNAMGDLPGDTPAGGMLYIFGLP